MSEDQDSPDSLAAALHYGLAVATDDVASALRWMIAQDFTLTHALGGESVGNVLLEFESQPIRVTVVRDRSQWMMNLGYLGDEEHGLHVVATARTGVEPTTPAQRARDSAMPEQLPEGLQWSIELPAIAAWMQAHDQRSAISWAEKSWQKTVLRYWRE